MKTTTLVTVTWFRALGMYALLCLACAVLSTTGQVADTTNGDSAFIVFLIALIACVFAFLYGLPGWVALMLVMQVLARPAARHRCLGGVLLVAGLLATHLSLYLALGLTLGDTRQATLLFSLPAYGSLLLSVLTLRPTLARHAAALRAPKPQPDTYYSGL